jgi:hypothetical protein
LHTLALRCEVSVKPILETLVLGDTRSPIFRRRVALLSELLRNLEARVGVELAAKPNANRECSMIALPDQLAWARPTTEQAW